jgi:hypothetical protein
MAGCGPAHSGKKQVKHEVAVVILTRQDPHKVDEPDEDEASLDERFYESGDSD